MSTKFEITTHLNIQLPPLTSDKFIWTTVNFYCPDADEVGAFPSIDVKVAIRIQENDSISDLEKKAIEKAKILLKNAAEFVEK